jgi:hypothetical protein
VVLIVIGVAILGLGVHYARRHRTPSGAQPLAGRVVDVSVKRSSLSNNPTVLYAASIAYRDPRTGEQQVLPPDSHRAQPLEVGDAVTLVRDPATGRVALPLARPRSQMALPFVFGLGVIALGVADLLG